jgi:hypothetical protein
VNSTLVILEYIEKDENCVVTIHISYALTALSYRTVERKLLREVHLETMKIRNIVNSDNYFCHN